MLMATSSTIGIGVRISGTARIDRRTKRLVTRLRPGDIAIISHHDLDTPCAQALVACRVAAVINAEHSVTERYPSLGTQVLVDAGIYLLDNAGPEVMERIVEGSPVEIRDDRVIAGGQVIARGDVMTPIALQIRLEAARANLGSRLHEFVENTLGFVVAEQALLFEAAEVPDLKTDFRGRHALVVVRGENCEADLGAIRGYVADARPVLVGVDGGADVLARAGYRPDLIIGDMDSVTDATLQAGSELVVHAYPDGRAPGLPRLEALGVAERAKVFRCRGTSEDAAMLLAQEKGAELIIAVGTHSSLIEFLDKARDGMASTFLTRLRVGSMLVDAKGVSQLHPKGVPWRYLCYLVGVAALAGAAVYYRSPGLQNVLRLIALKLRVWFGL
jgi:uncharacterized membrane-anchored protein